MKFEDIVIIKKEVVVTLIPYGESLELYPGTECLITQALGDSFTLNVNGNLVRLEGSDADAIGKEMPALPEYYRQVTGGVVTEEMVRTELRSCYDPEIPVNIVDLGLIYCITLTQQPSGGYHVDIEMTLTAPGCGMGPHIVSDAKERCYQISNIIEVDVELVFDPPWSQEMMSEAAQLELGLM